MPSSSECQAAPRVLLLRVFWGRVVATVSFSSLLLYVLVTAGHFAGSLSDSSASPAEDIKTKMGWTPLHTSAFHGQVVRCRNACICRTACLRAQPAFRLPASTSCCSPRPMSTARPSLSLTVISHLRDIKSWRRSTAAPRSCSRRLRPSACLRQLVDKPRSRRRGLKRCASTLRAGMKSWT